MEAHVFKKRKYEEDADINMYELQSEILKSLSPELQEKYKSLDKYLIGVTFDEVKSFVWSKEHIGCYIDSCHRILFATFLKKIIYPDRCWIDV